MSDTMEQKLARMTNEAARSASRALAKLSGEKVAVVVSKTEITKIQGRFPDIEPETIVAGIYLPITGDVKGASLLIFPEKTAYTLCDVLVKRKPGTTRKLTELDKSALKEVGNIVCGSFLTVFSNTLKAKLIGDVPSLSLDMFGAVVDVIVTGFAKKVEDVLVIEVRFVFEKADIKGYIALIFEFEQMKAIMKALEGGS
ncbi:MAG: chemotaxis protein CheC [Bacteroidetes bacterium]|nr:chemotaxis protein CheC [Bacteroidota bacterium]MBE3113279.1 chemotaxis protein CheC [Actinomycetota bacterium]